MFLAKKFEVVTYLYFLFVTPLVTSAPFIKRIKSSVVSFDLTITKLTHLNYLMLERRLTILQPTNGDVHPTEKTTKAT